MDAGAHFHCCDLQVHTPRDQAWVGECPRTEDDRRVYAAEFIQICRRKGLDAVAITDHHDLAFFPYIRDAAANETSDGGRPISPLKRIVVFPGMELTLGLPCQALLLFDPDVGDTDLDRAVATLGISPAPRSDLKAINPVQRLSIDDLNEIYRRLSEHVSL